VLSLDVLRGVAMAAMVIVSNPGDAGHVYWPLAHAAWDGWTPADLICAFFLFAAGAAIPLSGRSSRWTRIIRRGLLLVAAGLLLGGYPDFDPSRWRIPGELQRVGICYLVAAGAYRATTGDARRRGAILMSAAVFLAIGYWLVMQHVPVPGGVAGDLSPRGNLGAYVDRTLMGGHLARLGWDPDGLLATLSAVATMLFGVVCGLCLQSGAPAGRKASQIAAAGAGGIIGGQLWGVVVPINKSLWSSSFAVFGAGAASLLLGICHWAIEVKGWRGWTKPFAILGANALTLYVASSLLRKTLASVTVASADGRLLPVDQHLYLQYFAPLAPPSAASLLYALVNLVVLFGLLALMYRRRIFLRL
jgi:predicted acyltransferase